MHVHLHRGGEGGEGGWSEQTGDGGGRMRSEEWGSASCVPQRSELRCDRACDSRRRRASRAFRRNKHAPGSGHSATRQAVGSRRGDSCPCAAASRVGRALSPPSPTRRTAAARRRSRAAAQSGRARTPRSLAGRPRSRPRPSASRRRRVHRRTRGATCVARPAVYIIVRGQFACATCEARHARRGGRSNVHSAIVSRAVSPAEHVTRKRR